MAIDDDKQKPKPGERIQVYPQNFYFHETTIARFRHPQIINDPKLTHRLLHVLFDYATKGIIPEFDNKNPGENVVALMFDFSRPYVDFDVEKWRSKVRAGALKPETDNKGNPFSNQPKRLAEYCEQIRLDEETRRLEREAQRQRNEALQAQIDAQNRRDELDKQQRDEAELRKTSRQHFAKAILGEFIQTFINSTRTLRENPSLLYVDELNSIAFVLEHRLDYAPSVLRDRISQLLFRYGENFAFTKKLKNLKPGDKIDFLDLLKRYTKKAEDYFEAQSRNYVHHVANAMHLKIPNDNSGDDGNKSNAR